MDTSPHSSTPRSSTGGLRRNWPAIVLVLAIAAVYFVTARPVPRPEGWGESYQQALEQAGSSGKPLLVAFYMDGCPPCKLMDRRVLPDDAVQQAIAGFVPVRVDVDQDRELAFRYGVEGTPAYAVIRPDGQLVSRIEGFHPVDEFLRFLQTSTAELNGRAAPGVRPAADRHEVG